MDFRDIVLTAGTRLAFVQRNSIFSDKLIGYGECSDNTYIQDMGYQEIKMEDFDVLYLNPRTGCIMGEDDMEVFLYGYEDLRENILCRAFDWILIKTIGKINVRDSNEGACV